MFALPLPYISVLLLLVLMMRLTVHPRRDLRVLLFVALSTLVMLLVGLRWSLPQYPRLWFALALVSSLQPPTAWLCFHRPANPSPAKSMWQHLLLFVATPVIWALLLAGVPYWNWAEVVLVTLFAVYGTALLLWGLGWPARLDGMRLSQVHSIQHAAVWVGCVLWLNGVIEALVAVDFALYGGQHAAAVVTYAQMVLLVPFIYGIVQAGAVFASQPVSQGVENQASAPAEPETGQMPQGAVLPLNDTPQQDSDAHTVQRLTTLVQEQALFRDPDLTLIKLARRMGVPARELSGAVNRHTGKNMAQWINTFRIEATQKQLAETELPVNDIMLDCGFYTKSNFNEAFRRHTGLSPSAYRQAHRTSAARVESGA